MPVTVSRIYDSQQKAANAASELTKYSFSPDQVTVVAPGGSSESAVASLTKGGISSSRAGAYAEAVSRGQSVVTVQPSFGNAARAAEILDSFGPVDTHISDVPDTVERKGGGYSTRSATVADPAAPLSSKFGWAVLSDDPTPLSNKLGWRVLSEKSELLSDKLGWPTLSQNQDSKASLSQDPTPLSSKFGWRLLSDDPAPASSKFGWRILSDDPTPLSSKFGWRVLSENQGPSASLIHNPAPLSSWLGLPVLLNESKKSA